MDKSYFNIITEAYTGYFDYLWREITFSYSYKPWWENYFWLLVSISLLFFLLEWARPWRIDQPKFRKDFWVDCFYMFFNFFLFSLIFYNAFSDVFVNLFNALLMRFGWENIVAVHIELWPVWSQLLFLFVLRDFIHWWVHQLLHRNAVLWEFHKVHHSAEQMGFAAHLRFHWMETIVYRTIEYIPLAMIGFGIDDFFIVHLIALAIGHWNHANFRVNIGPLQYIFNSPRMHIWHHAKELPSEKRYGVNFGLSLSVWDFLFGTNYIPREGKDIPLGFQGVEVFPKSFRHQVVYGFRRKKMAAPGSLNRRTSRIKTGDGEV